ncbi:hypothetical protein J4410_00870 [Candidatus Woesearchaeota archaeon]|nr:hypothetical protein [Candidatus Woesearchaeota archaeon]
MSLEKTLNELEDEYYAQLWISRLEQEGGWESIPSQEGTLEEQWYKARHALLKRALIKNPVIGKIIRGGFREYAQELIDQISAGVTDDSPPRVTQEYSDFLSQLNDISGYTFYWLGAKVGSMRRDYEITQKSFWRRWIAKMRKPPWKKKEYRDLVDEEVHTLREHMEKVETFVLSIYCLERIIDPNTSFDNSKYVRS